MSELCARRFPPWNGACPFQSGKNVCLVLIWIESLFHSIRLHMCLHMAMWACGFLFEPMSYNPLLSLILMPSLFKTNLMEAPSRWLIYLLICVSHPHFASLFFWYTQIDFFTLHDSNCRHFSKYLYVFFFFFVWAGPKKPRSRNYLGFAMVSSFPTQLEKASSLRVTGIQELNIYNCLNARLQKKVRALVHCLPGTQKLSSLWMLPSQCYPTQISLTLIGSLTAMDA